MTSQSLLTSTALLTAALAFLLPPSAAKFSDQLAPKPAAPDKLTHLHFFFHDIVSGPHPTAVTVAGRKNTFGGTAVIDDPLTEGPAPRSRVVGRAQGLYSMSSEDRASLLMAVNFVFAVGEYNGSSISVLGRNAFLESVREMPIVGGSGVFRFARGYALAKTERYSVATGDAVVEYNVFVMHH